MKSAQITDLFRELKKSFNRYISILLIMALGVAFYAGVRSAEPDMKGTVKEFYDTTNYMDIRVLGTLGMTEDDVEEIRKIEGIKTAEGSYQTELFLVSEMRDYQMSVYSMTDTLNQLYITEGRIPSAKNECFMDEAFLSKTGYQIGDVITLKAEEDTELSDVLHCDTFTIVGYGAFPTYLTWSRGAVSIGSGVEDGFLFLPKEAFSMEVFAAVYATVEGAKDYNPYSEEYEELIETVTERIEAIADTRCEIRFAEITEPYWEDIREAEAEIADGEQELVDAEKEIADGEQELIDGEQEIIDGEKELADAEKEIADGEKELADAEKEIADGEKELADGEKELADGEKEIADAEKELAKAEKELADGEKEIAENEKTLLDGEQELVASEEQLKQAEQTIADNEAKLAEAEAELATKEAEFLVGQQQLEAGRLELEAGKEELSKQEAELLQAKAMLEAYGMPLTEELIAGEAQLNVAKQVLAEKEAELVAGEEQAALGKLQLEAGKEELAKGKAELEAGKTELEKKKQELLAGRTEIEQGKAQLEEAKKEIETGKTELAKAKQELEKGKKEVADAKKELSDGKAELEKARKEILDGKAELEKAKQEVLDGKAEIEKAKQEVLDGKAELEEAKQKLEDGKQELEDGKKELEDGKQELEDGKQELADAKQELEDIEMAEWYVLDRNTVQSFVEFGMDAERIGKIGKVFPAVFYLVAALVSLTTMTRMIEEERTQIGTMKALGYSKGAIASKYLCYSLSATLFGGVLGVVVGSRVLPWIIIKAYKILYSHIPNELTPIQWDLAIASVMIAVVCTIVATVASCYKELSATPAILMRPTAPVAGKRVFLEYITPLWNRMSFSWKATWRNLFRYKKRFFMTIFGIGGCMALLLVGYGLQDSIAEIVNNQYKKIWTYDAYLSITGTEFDVAEQDLDKVIENQMFIQLKTVDAESETALKSAQLFIPERLDDLEGFLKLQDRITKEKYALEEQGVVISEKLSTMLDVAVGDSIEIYVDDVTKKPVKITAISENYMSHYIYMSGKQYEALYGEQPEYNQLYFHLSNMTDTQKEELSTRFLALEEVSSVTYVDELQEDVASMMESLNLVIIVLIVAAGMLAFIVLYNLNNINMIERRRELATLKVLGFYDGEVGMYMYRENILLTIFGIFAGVVLGIILHRFVILTCEIDMIMFGRSISAKSYLYSVLLTCLFSLVVNGGMFFKLRKIDMVESLKSAE